MSSFKAREPEKAVIFCFHSPYYHHNNMINCQQSPLPHDTNTAMHNIVLQAENISGQMIKSSAGLRYE